MNNTKKHFDEIKQIYEFFGVPDELRFSLKITGISKYNYGVSGAKQHLFYINFNNGTKCIINLDEGGYSSDILEISYLSDNVLHREDYLASYIKMYRKHDNSNTHIHELTYSINGTLIENGELEMLKKRHTILKKLQAEV